MVAYSFQPQFVAPILAGTKRQTIRGERKRHAAAGETLQLFTGLRTKACRLIGTAVCEHAQPIVLVLEPSKTAIGTGRHVAMTPMDGRRWYGAADAEEFAQRDGFASWEELLAFWAKHHPGKATFGGTLITWRDFRPASDDGIGRLSSARSTSLTGSRISP